MSSSKKIIAGIAIIAIATIGYLTYLFLGGGTNFDDNKKNNLHKNWKQFQRCSNGFK